ncbi:DUF1349 domain-containing protein [Deinococcus cellulosilyticus]|uniref:Uncharacterized protein n=1 Tax=Deinococcus cellulosilyticus (strain DSM 18568 / NBRC 106333 / KACC 11606 / 5516J-15) TaxID=1223518 RepID=A0A511N625_DEIC1|nr:DUF1349 domain-containing protein [Deinococcus cellulosilyticus]GEM48319.1 hypothetical protein DC3_39540 [Deinococcus cellulosilyticus NBRC 106333 = KACC 11606]
MPRTHFLRALTSLAVLLAFNAQATPDDLSVLNDEFNRADSLVQWQRHDVVEGWPSQWKALDIHTTSPGHLYIEPLTSGWYAGYRAPFLFKEVTGDFVVTTRLKVEGRGGGVPQRMYSLMGLMAREPHPEVTPETWKEEEENWVFLTTGTTEPAGQPHWEVKTTVQGHSTLQVAQAPTGWVEVALLRKGAAFLFLQRQDGGTWTVHQRYLRPDLPATLQVGIIAYTDYNTLRNVMGPPHTRRTDPRVYNNRVYEGTPDLKGWVDWVHFKRPQVSSDAMNLDWSDPALVSDAKVMQLLEE